MLKKLITFYRQYKDYIRVDLVMYAVMILMIVIYAIYTMVFL